MHVATAATRARCAPVSAGRSAWLDDDDRLWFIEEMKKQTQKHFDLNMDTLFKEFDMNQNGEVDDDAVR